MSTETSQNFLLAILDALRDYDARAGVVELHH